MTDRDDERQPEEGPPPGAEPEPPTWVWAARPDDEPRPPASAGGVGGLAPPRYDDGDSRVFYEGDG